MSFNATSNPQTSAKVVDSSSNAVNKNANGIIYGSEDIKQYEALSDGLLLDYSSLGANQKISAPASESVGIRGAVSIPVAASYGDAKVGITELMANSGDLAAAAGAGNIELCGFLSNLPSLNIDMSAPQLGIPALQDIMNGINGLSLPVLEFASEAIVGALGGAAKAAGDLASALQSNIPTITCGAALPIPPISPATLASALIPGAPIVTALAPIAIKQIGITPPINVSSPDVTVQSLSDVLEAGEF